MHTPTNHAAFLSTRRGKLTLALVCLAGFLDEGLRWKGWG